MFHRFTKASKPKQPKNSAFAAKSERGGAEIARGREAKVAGLPQARPIISDQNRIAGIRGIVFHARWIASHEALKAHLAFEASDVLRGLIRDSGDRIAVGNQVARACVC